MSTEPARLLLLEDDPAIAGTVVFALQREGFAVQHVLLVREAEARLHAVDLLLLDVGLPDGNGLDLCRSLRQHADARMRTLPVLMLTARGEEADRIVGLEMGADDYLGKPFDPRELVARIEAVLRRGTRPPAAPDPEGGVTRFGGWLFDRGSRQLSKDGQVVALTSGEFALLNALVANANQPMKRERLLELTRGEMTEAFDRAIDVQIHRLRRLIEVDPARPRYLQTVWGIGYVFVPDSASGATE